MTDSHAVCSYQVEPDKCNFLPRGVYKTVGVKEIVRRIIYALRTLVRLSQWWHFTIAFLGNASMSKYEM